MSRVACCHEGCGAVVCFDDTTEDRLRRTHESWVCPFGHSQHFAQKTAEEREIEQLRRSRSHYQENARMWMRIAHTCPWPACGRELGDLRRHLQRVHGMPTLAAVREQEEEAS